VRELWRLPGSRTNPHLVAARVRYSSRGGNTKQAVKAFAALRQASKEEVPEARAAGRALIAEGKAAGPKHRTFVFVNNRLEGNAISAITAMLEAGLDGQT